MGIEVVCLFFALRLARRFLAEGFKFDINEVKYRALQSGGMLSVGSGSVFDMSCQVYSLPD